MSRIFGVKLPKRGIKVKTTHIYNRFSVTAQIWTDIYESKNLQKVIRSGSYFGFWSSLLLCLPRMKCMV